MSESAKEQYPCFVQVTDDEQMESVIELPTEKYGTMLLSTIQAQYPNAIGLKYKSSSGAWRGVRLSDNVLDPPYEGWGTTIYLITLPKTDSVKRKMEESPNREPEAKLVKTSENDFLSDLIVLGLPYKATEHDLKEYFQQYGELAMHEIKYDPVSKESRGFGFIRFKAATSAQKVLKSNHTILGRRCEVRMPKKKDEMPLKLFVGRLADGTNQEDLTEYFSEYGDLNDVYIPNPFRGFGFVTFAASDVARQVLHTTHTLKGNRLNVTYAEPKDVKTSSRNSRQSSRSQDRPFDFEDMRQIMYNNSRQMSDPYRSYGSSNSKSSRDSAGYNNPYPGDNRSSSNMFYGYSGASNSPSAYQPRATVTYPPSSSSERVVPHYAQQQSTTDRAMQQAMAQYGAYWSNSK